MRFIAFEDGKWAPRDDLDRAGARTLALGPTQVWVRAEDVDRSTWDDLGQWFDLHALALEDIGNPRQRPKVEDYDDVTFCVLRYPVWDEEEDLQWNQVGVFLGEGFVMTATPQMTGVLDVVEERIRSGVWARDGRADQVFYHIVDTIVDAYYPVMEDFEDRLEDLEDIVVEEPGLEALQEIRDIKSQMSRMRKIAPPMRDTMMALERSPHPNLGEDLRLFLRDVSDHAIRVAERMEHVRETALITHEAWNASLANRQAAIGIEQNQVMKRLTVIAGLLLLPSLLAGLGGMNFPGIPQWDYWVVTTGILGLALLGVTVAAWRKWL